MTNLEDQKNKNSNERKGKLAKMLIGSKNIHLVIYNDEKVLQNEKYHRKNKQMFPHKLYIVV